jgi:hypothetical protein
MTRRILMVMGLVLLGAAAGLASTLSGGAPGGAIDPGPINLPALQLFATNACTGTAITGLSAELSLVTAAGGIQPGPIQNVGHTHKWTTTAVPPGTYDLSLSAASFSGIGDETTGSSPIQVTINPGPTNLVADSGLAETQVIAVSMVPLAYPPNPCLDLPALTIPQVALQLDDGSTNQPLANPGPIQLQTPSGGAVNPGAQNTPVEAFAWPAGTLGAGIYYFFDHGSQGHYLLGTSPDGTVNPLPVTIYTPPAPSLIPAGDSVNYGISAIASLAPEQTQPTITFAVPEDAATGAKVIVKGSGFAGTYEVLFGPATSVPFTVNKAGTAITTAVPAGPAGIDDITVTNLAGSATTPFAHT